MVSGTDANLYAYVGNDPIDYFDPYGLGKFGAAIRIGKAGLKRLGNYSRDQAKREFKRGGDVHGSKKAMKAWAKDKGKGKPIREKHGEGNTHWHDPSRSGGHGFENAPGVVIPGSALGKELFGDNLVGEAADFFNPLSDAQDLLDFVGELFGDDDADPSADCEGGTGAGASDE